MRGQTYEAPCQNGAFGGFISAGQVQQQQGAEHSPGIELVVRASCMGQVIRWEKINTQGLYLVLNTSGELPFLPEPLPLPAAPFGGQPLPALTW